MCSCGSKMLVMMGKWSVAVGHFEGFTSQIMMRSEIPPVQKMLSGLKYFFVNIYCRVWIPFGSGILRSNVARCLISPSMALVAL